MVKNLGKGTSSPYAAPHPYAKGKRNVVEGAPAPYPSKKRGTSDGHLVTPRQAQKRHSYYKKQFERGEDKQAL